MALSFDGATNLSLGSLLTQYPMTIASWVKSSVLTADQAVFSFSEPGNADLFMLDVINGVPRASVKAANVFAAATSTGGSIGTVAFSLLSAVFSSPTLRKIYVNGVATGTNATNLTPIAANITTSTIGGLSGATPYHGVEAYTTIWNINLSASDNLNLYGNGSSADPNAIQPASIVSMMKFGSGPPFVDFNNGLTWNVTGSPALAADPFTLNNINATAALR